MDNKVKNKLAFTLAEVLITLLIIGVVTSLIVPNLIADTQEQEYRVAWKKSYQNISNAVLLMKNDKGTNLSDANVFLNTIRMRDEFANYFKVIKKCNDSEGNGCWANDWKNINGNTMYEFSLPGFIITDGTSFVFSIDTTTCTHPQRCGWIAVDVNGPKLPNTIGKDIFMAQISDKFAKPIHDGYGCNLGIGTWAGLDCSLEYLK